MHIICHFQVYLYCEKCIQISFAFEQIETEINAHVQPIFTIKSDCIQFQQYRVHKRDFHFDFNLNFNHQQQV